MTHIRLLILSAVACFVVLAAGGAFIDVAERRHADAHRHVLKEIGAAHARLLERQFDRSLSSTFALASILRQSGKIDNFDTLAAEIIESYGGIDNLQLAPNGVVTQIYPVAGNEAAIGHNLLEDPRRRTEALKAIESRRLTLAGPFPLVQGGVGVIGRLPVFVTDQTGGERFWGFTIALIDLNDLLEVGGLNRLVERDYEYELSRIDPDSGLKAVFAGSGSMDTDLQNPISFEIDVPNGTWTLTVAPRDGWPFSSSFPLEIISVVLASMAVGGFTYYLLRQPAILRREVKRRTQDLMETVQLLGAEITQRERAEVTVRKSEERLRVLLETTNALPWEADAKTWQFTYVGPQAVRLLGYPIDQWYENDFWVAHIHPEDRKFAVEFCQESASRSDDYEFEYRMIAADGMIVWIHDIVNVVTVNGVPRVLHGFMIDITERKEAEEALGLSEERYRDLYENAPDMFCSVDAATGKIVQCNETLVSNTGYTKEEIIGRHIFEVYHPECGEEMKKTFQVFHQTGEVRDVELQLRRKDGSKLDVSLNVSSLRDEEGTVVQSRSVWRDIGRHKRAEEALRMSETALRESQKDLQVLAGKLLSAQEEERRLLARELHDDMTQRLAVLAIEVGKLEQQLQTAPDPVLGRLRETKEQMVRLSADVHVISRQLHPAILDDLGLVSAIESECSNFSQREGIVVKYEAQNVPPTLPKNVALCIYRVAQEGLRNIAKHAQTQEAYVTLGGTDDTVLLSIGDDGIGFDPSQLRGKAGLGLASIEERIRLIQGDLSLRSQPGGGTVIEVRAPLPREEV